MIREDEYSEQPLPQPAPDVTIRTWDGRMVNPYWTTQNVLRYQIEIQFAPQADAQI